MEHTPEGQKKEWTSAHANRIREMNIADEREIEKWMDALCMDENISRRILGNEVYELVKGDLIVSKNFLDTENNEAIKALPEFQEFLKNFTIEKEKENIRDKQERELEEKKNALASMDIPEDIQKSKQELDKIKNAIRTIIDEKKEKSEGGYMTCFEIAKKSRIDDTEKKAILTIIYDFIFDHMENSTGKKKRKADESSRAFYQRIGTDYFLESVRKKIQEKEKKINEKMKVRKEKIQAKIKTPTKIEEVKKEYTTEAIKKFRGIITNNKSITARYYLPEEKAEIEHIQDYFKKHMKETIPSPKMEDMIKTMSQGDTMEKEDNKIKMPINDYSEVDVRRNNFQDKFKKGKREAKTYLFDRLVEYAGMDILKHEIQQTIKQKKYKIEGYKIYKTDSLDDSSAGADYVILYKFKNGEREKIAPIDLFISDKILKDKGEQKEGEKPESGSLEEKLEEAKILKAPYSTYIKLFKESDQKTYKIKKLKRYVEQQHPALTYSFLQEIIKNKTVDTQEFLESFEKKGKLYTMIQHQQEKDRNVKEKVEQHLAKDIVQEMEKVAA